MQEIRHFIRNYFGFSQTESNGFLVLLGISIGLLITPLGYAYWGKIMPLPIESAKLDAMIAETEQALMIENTPESVEYFPFNPNTISLKEWQQLGVPDYLAERILNYLQKGGSFRKKSDLARIYGFPEELYQKLSPHIQLPEKVTYEKKYKKQKNYDQQKKYAKKKNDNAKKSDKNEDNNAQKAEEENKPSTTKPTNIQPFELNTATAEDLKQIKGIGDKLSKRIIDYRNLLGGFANITQLSEVYGLEPEVIQELTRYTTLNINQLQKININQATVEMLDKHPYIDKKLAGIIVKYRQQHGNFDNIEDLKNIKILDVQTLEKIAPYLAF